MWWPNREIVIICWQTPSAYYKTAKVLSQRFNRLHQFHWKRGHYSCFNGCNEPEYKHTTRGKHQTVCSACETFYLNKPQIQKAPLEQVLRLILRENSFHFNGKTYLQIHGTAMGTKMVVAFPNIFMSMVETDILSQSACWPLVWKHCTDNTFSLWTINRVEISQFIEQANSHHPTRTFMVEISKTETTFPDTAISKGKRFLKDSVLSETYRNLPFISYKRKHSLKDILVRAKLWKRL